MRAATPLSAQPEGEQMTDAPHEHDEQDDEQAENDADRLAPDEQEADEPEQTPAEAAQRDGSEQTLKKADAANRAYMQKLEKILGADDDRHECAACNGLGVTWGATVAEPELKQADDAEPCPKCNAYGMTITGSRDPGQATKPCGECGGRGWRNVVVQLAPVAPIAPHEMTPATAQMGTMQPDGTFVPFGVAPSSQYGGAGQ